MASKGLQGCEARLQRGDEFTATNFVNLAYVISANGPSRTRNDIDVTTIDSPNCTKEFDPGLKDGGTIDFVVIFNPLTQTTHDAAAGIIHDYENEVKRFWRVLLVGDGSSWAEDFPAYFTNLSGPQIVSDDDVRVSGQLKVAGAITSHII